MRVTVEATQNNRGFGAQYQLKILDGYRKGEFVQNFASRQPLFDVDSHRLSDWAKNTGYEVVSNECEGATC